MAEYVVTTLEGRKEDPLRTYWTATCKGPRRTGYSSERGSEAAAIKNAVNNCLHVEGRESRG